MTKNEKRHPLPWLDFWRLFLEQLPECGTVAGAYEKAEQITVEKYKRRRFASYQAFRNRKSRFYKKSCNHSTPFRH